MAYDLLIKNGRIVDGSGGPAFSGDVAVQGGKIVGIGKFTASATCIITADGRVVAPGFIDHHTHFDSQAMWDPIVTSTSLNGNTSIIVGQCGAVIAPVRPGDGDWYLQMFNYMEGIPLASQRAGVDFAWETIPQYLDAVGRRRGINVGAFVGHSGVRRYVMGAAAQEREATPEEIEAMQRVVREGMMAGALGFSVGNFVGQGEGLFGVKVPSSVATDGGARPDKGDRTDYSTRLLSHWVRDRQVMSLEEAVYRMTGKTALMHDLHDRGFLSPGKAADITIFDPDTIGPKPREPLYEFPGGEMHVKQGAVGIDYVIVNGEVLLDHGEYTGALPGQTLRSPLYCGKRESVS